MHFSVFTLNQITLHRVVVLFKTLRLFETFKIYSE